MHGAGAQIHLLGTSRCSDHFLLGLQVYLSVQVGLLLFLGFLVHIYALVMLLLLASSHNHGRRKIAQLWSNTYGQLTTVKGRVACDVVGGTERYIETVGILVRLRHDLWNPLACLATGIYQPRTGSTYTNK